MGINYNFLFVGRGEENKKITMEEPRITKAQQVKDIIEPIPDDKFQIGLFGWSPNDAFGKNIGMTDNGCSCVLGHIHRHFEPSNPYAMGDGNGWGFRELSNQFLKKKYGLVAHSAATINNTTAINGYSEPEIKDRVMHLINDMIQAGY